MGRPEDKLAIAHLTATFPPYPGGAGNTAFRFAREQAARGHRVEVFTAPAPGEPPDPGAAVGPPHRAGVRDRQRAADPRAGGDRGLRRRPPALPVHLRLRADPARPAAAAPARAGAARPLQEPARRQGRARGAVRALRALGRPGADPRRRPGLRALARPRRVGARTWRASAGAIRRSWSRCRTASTRSCSRPERTRAGSRERLGIPRRRGGRRVRRHPRPRAPLQAPRRRDRRPRTTGRRARPPRRRGRRRATRRLPRPGLRGRGRRPGPFPRRRPPRRAAGRSARRRPLPAHDRAAGVVRDRPDRGDGLRAAGDRDRLPGGAGGDRRGRDRGAGAGAATPARSPRRCAP